MVWSIPDRPKPGHSGPTNHKGANQNRPGSRRKRARRSWSRRTPQHETKTLVAVKNDNTPDWLSDANIESFMASVDADVAIAA